MDRKAIHDIARLFLYESDLEPSNSHYSACIEMFTLLQPINQPHHYELPLHERVGLALKIITPWAKKGDVFRAVLTCDIFPSPAVSIRDYDGRTLLHAVAENIGNGRDSDENRDPSVPLISLLS